MSETKNVLRVENVTMQFGGVVAVDDLSMEVNEGEIVALIGPNGAGKTTAFNVITGVYAPTNGQVLFDGKKVVENHPRGKMRRQYKGIVEYAKTEDIFSHPRHPYTEGLMSAVPIPDPSLRGKRPKVILEGDLPSPAAPPPGCHFHTRCRYATEECSHTPPKMCEVEPGHFCACHHPLKDAVGTVLK